MSMEINVLFRGALPDKAALTQAMKDLGFPITIPYGREPLEGHKGFLPMRLRRERSGVEFDVFEGRDNIEEVANGLEVDPTFDRSANFRWGGDEGEMLCALCASAALARLMGGVVLGEDDEKPLSPHEAIAAVRKHLDDTRKARRKDKRPGTSRSDLKRYLKPLLEQRSDLVLVGNLLVIRPVRHILRGAFFERIGVKNWFRIWWYVQALYDPYSSLGYGDYVFTNSTWVWEPYFEPLLMDTLAEDIFSRSGSIRTLTDFADALAISTRFVDFSSARVKALVLAGERNLAEEVVRERPRRDPDNAYWRYWADGQREFLARDVKDVCVECHATEAETVREMKIDAIWEPSPFPIELASSERSGVDEPLFLPAPWISRPPWLLDQPPERPGDMRFSKSIIRRNGRVLMLVPLAREDAEARHRDGEAYIFAVRLSNGPLAILFYDGMDRHDPHRREMPSSPAKLSSLEIHGADYFVDLSLLTADKTIGAAAPIDGEARKADHGRQCMNLFKVYECKTNRNIWSCDLLANDASIHDERQRGDRIYTRRALTEAEQRLLICPPAEFSEFEDVVARARAWLRSAGYGEITHPWPSGLGT